MSWFSTDNNDNKNDDKEKQTMSHRFLTACLLLLGGVIALWIAIELLARFWGWLLLAAGIILAGWIAFKLIHARRNRW